MFLSGAEGFMYRRALRFSVAACLILIPSAAAAQMIWQPTPPPLVTADNEPWYRAGAPIEWNGDLYYPAGAQQGFDRVQMVRSGSYRGIPLYTDVTIEPYSIVFVPLSGERMQPYERPRAGALAGSTGSRAPSFPPQTAGELSLSATGNVVQAAAPPTFARAYDLGSPPAPAATSGYTGPAAAPNSAVATAGRSVVTTTNRPVATAIPPRGVNGIWIDYEGRHWVATGKAIELTPSLKYVGSYRGFPVYARAGDRSTIFIPSTAGLVVPYSPRGR
jgi:hypothetical protein